MVKIPVAPILSELGAEFVPEGLGWIKMRCFAHPDRTPSAAVNHELQAFVCHSCGRSGDAIKLLRSELGLSFKEAKERAESLTGVSPEKPAKRRRRPSDILKGKQ